LGNLFSDWLQTSIYQILAAFTCKKQQGHAPCRILKMCINVASTVSVVAFGNRGIALISVFITEFLTAVINKNTMYER